MTKFETGKRYKAETSMAVFEVVKRTNKFVTVAFIHHYGRFNEKLAEPKKLKVNVWAMKKYYFLQIMKYMQIMNIKERNNTCGKSNMIIIQALYLILSMRW